MPQFPQLQSGSYGKDQIYHARSSPEKNWPSIKSDVKLSALRSVEALSALALVWCVPPSLIGLKINRRDHKRISVILFTF